jgi:hypothetical protein
VAAHNELSHLVQEPAVECYREIRSMPAPQEVGELTIDQRMIGGKLPRKRLGERSGSHTSRGRASCVWLGTLPKYHCRGNASSASHSLADYAELCVAALTDAPSHIATLARPTRHYRDLGIKNAIRPSAIGKKNWLFIGHPAAGQRSAIIYSLVVSCERHGKDPLAYLRDVLSRLPSMTNQDDLTPLTPAGWQPA